MQSYCDVETWAEGTAEEAEGEPSEVYTLAEHAKLNVGRNKFAIWKRPPQKPKPGEEEKEQKEAEDVYVEVVEFLTQDYGGRDGSLRAAAYRVRIHSTDENANMSLKKAKPSDLRVIEDPEIQNKLKKEANARENKQNRKAREAKATTAEYDISASKKDALLKMLNALKTKVDALEKENKELKAENAALRGETKDAAPAEEKTAPVEELN